MAQTHPTIVGMGNPLLDISAEVPQEILTKYELTMNNAILAEDKHLPLYREMVDNFPCEYIAGGATQNSIRVAQWMSQTPNFTAFLGCIGNDEFGQKLREAAARDGVTTYYQVDETTPTGTCAVLIQDKERSLVANISAANNFNIEHLRANFNVVQNARIFYVSGFFLTVSPASILEVARHALENDKVFGLNLGALFLVEFFKDQMMSVYPYTDYVFGNESEALKFSEVHGFGTTDMKEIAVRLAQLPKEGNKTRTVVITQGADPTVVAIGDQVTEYPVDTQLEPSRIIDTNGAGDSFVGGFLAELAKGSPIERCVAAGNYAAGEVIQRSGCTFPSRPTFQ